MENASDDVLDGTARLFELSVKAEFEALRARYDVPATYDLGVVVKHSPGGYSVMRFRITSGAVTIRREMKIDLLETVQSSSRKMQDAIMAICRTFAQQFPKEKKR